MKTKPVIVALAVLVSTPSFGAPFRNLDFDNANTNNLVNLGALYGIPEDLVPGWQLYVGSILLFGPIVGYNGRPPGFGSVSLFDRFNSSSFPELQRIPVEGLFAFGLNPGGPFLPGDPHFLVQVGEIPADALSLRFSAFGEPLDLFIDGVLVPPLYEYESLPPGTLPADHSRASVIGDVSQFAGQTAELRFRATWTFGGSVFHGLDSIYFSPIPVPEPGTWSVFGVSAGVLGWRWRRFLFRS